MATMHFSLPRAVADGFTLVELMITLVIVAILLGLAAPSFRNTILDSRRSSLVNELLISLQSARVEALKQSRDVYVCPTTDGGASCSTTVTAWTTGWMVWVDLDGDATFDSPGELIRYQANESEGMSVTTNAGSARFRYRPFQVGLAGGRLVVCDPRGPSDANQHRGIVVADTGRPRVEKGDTAGICP